MLDIVRTKVITLSNGKKRGGVPYGKGALAYLLKNRCYVGEILHKGQVHIADHQPIIARETFDAVQASLAANSIERKATAKASPFLLTGLLFDSTGNRMTPCPYPRRSSSCEYCKKGRSGGWAVPKQRKLMSAS
jgi:site-specific DNA recombinase